MKIAIVGAGLMGRLLALQLAQTRDYQITLYDRDSSKSCAMAAAGMLTPYGELEKADQHIMQAGLQGLQLWPLLLKTLGQPTYFKQQGSLVTAHAKDRTDLTHYLKRVMQYCTTEPFQAVVPETIEPEINAVNTWYYFQEEAYIDCQSLMHALSQYLLSRLSWHEGEAITAVRPHEIELASGKLHYDWVFDCRGMGAKENFNELRAIRGELIWLHAPAVNITRPVRFIHPRYAIYIVPRPNHHYVIGASEVEAEDYSEISVRTMMELLSAAYSVHKGFVDARIIRTVTQCRPTLLDHFPKIKYADGFTAINGLYRHGYLIAPTLAQDVAQYLNGGIKQVQQHTWWESYHD